MPRQGLGIGLGNSAGGIDPNAADFIIRAGITNAGQKSAINNLATSLKGAGLWSSFYGLYPIVGGTAGSHSENLISSSYDIVWNGTMNHSANGVKAAAEDAANYGDTTIPNNVAGNTSVSFGHYSRENFVTAVGHRAVIFNGLGGSFSPYVDGNHYVDSWEVTSRIGPIGGGIRSDGLLGSSRTASNDHRAYRNGAQIGSTSSGVQGAMNATTMMFGQSSHQIAFVYYAAGFTPTQNATLYTIVQAYQTALGRQV